MKENLLKIFNKLKAGFENIEEKHLVFFVFLVLGMYLLRTPFGWFGNSLWAEDGAIFLQQDYILGPKAFLKTYAGYHHWLMRSFAFVLGFFPLEWLPWLYKLSCLFVYLILCFYLMSSRLELEVNKRALLLIVMGFLPHGGEVFGNLANQMALACLFLILIPALEPPKKMHQWFIDLILFFLCAMTGPYILFLAPSIFVYTFFHWKWHQRKNQGLWFAFLSIVTTLAFTIQLFSAQLSKRFLSVDTDLTHWFHGLYMTFKPLILAEARVSFLLGSVFSVIIALSILRLIFWRKSLREVLLSREVYWTAAAFLILAATFYANRHQPGTLNPYQLGGRYFFAPYALILWSFIIAVPKTALDKKICFAVLSLSFLTSSFHLDSWIRHGDRSLSDQFKEFRLKGQANILISPPGWVLKLDQNKCWRCEISKSVP